MLKQLRLTITLKARKDDLAALLRQREAFESRKTELEKRTAEAGDDTDISEIKADFDALEKEVTEADTETKIKNVESEIVRIEQELAAFSGSDDNDTDPKNNENTGKRGKQPVNKFQIRRLLESGEYYERAEVKKFYEDFKNIRAVTGEGLTVPEIVVNRIMEIMGDYTTLYPLVDKIRASGTTRILMDTDTTAATWLEMRGTLPTSDVGTITDISFDGYKVGKVTFVDNCMLQDSIVNLDEYVARKIARAIALALDAAILNGTGDGDKQPTGIIPSLKAEHKVTVTDPVSVADIVRPISMIDNGKDSVGSITATMKRSTYYNRLLDFSIATTSAGEVIGKLPNLTRPDLLGLEVVFNNNVAADQILFGDYSKYTLVEREDITIDRSEHVKFAEDQTGFRGKGRFDGKPTDTDAFVLVTLVYTEPETETP